VIGREEEQEEEKEEEEKRREREEKRREENRREEKKRGKVKYTEEDEEGEIAHSISFSIFPRKEISVRDEKSRRSYRRRYRKASTW
jgi:hypothetical protein